MKYIKLWETWQWLGKQEQEEGDREYNCTVGELLDWAIGPDWREDSDLLFGELMVDNEWVDSASAIGYHRMLNRASDRKVLVESQEIDGQVDNSWSLDGVYFSLITWDWPFSNEGTSLTPDEEVAYLRLDRELEPEMESSGINRADIIDFVMEMTRRGQSAQELSVTGFKNWFRLKFAGSN